MLKLLYSHISDQIDMGRLRGFPVPMDNQHTVTTGFVGLIQSQEANKTGTYIQIV